LTNYLPSVIRGLFSALPATNSPRETTYAARTGIRRFNIIAGVLLIGLPIAGSALAQQFLISTIAGSAPPVTPAAAVGVSIGRPGGVATDSAGNLYFTSLNCVFKMATSGTLTLVAGDSRAGYSGDGGPASAAMLNNPLGLVFDHAGNLYIADTGNSRIRRVSPAGLITSVAGSGTQGYSGDGGPAAAAQLNLPEGIAVDAAGNIYIADTGNSVVRQVAPTGIIVTFAGKGGPGYYGDGGPATLAQVSNPEGLALDASGDLFIADTVNDVIRMVSPGGIISTVAGNGYNNLAGGGFAGDGGPATRAQLDAPAGVAVDASGNLYIADSQNYRIREVSSSGIITTIAGIGAPGYSGDGGPATSAEMSAPASIAVDSSGNVYFADRANARIRQISSSGGTISTAAGNGTTGYSGDGGPALDAQLDSPSAVAISGTFVYLADTGNARIRVISPSGAITTIAGNGTAGYSGDGGPAASAQLNFPRAIAADPLGNVYFSDTGNGRVRKISNGVISTVAGNGNTGYSGDGGPATSAALSYPAGLALDAAGNLYIADTGNSRIRKVSSAGIITTAAGSGRPGYSGDGGSAVSADLNYPNGVAVDTAGDLFIADTGNDAVREVSPAGVINTVAGTSVNTVNGTVGSPGYSGDGGPAIAAQLYNPYSVVTDGKGDVFIVDTGNSVIRELTPNGNIATVAGGGPYYPGDGGPATNALLTNLAGLAVDGSGNLYTTDSHSSIRLLQPTNQSVLIGAVVDGASESAVPISPGKIIDIYGGGLGPASLVLNQAENGVLGTQAGGTTVSINGTPAAVLFSSARQVSAIVPYEIAGATTAQVTVSYQGQVSAAATVPVAASAPSFFSQNLTGAGQIAAINTDGSPNNAAHPVKIGGIVSLYATGEGQTNPPGMDGALAATLPYPAPVLPVHVTVGGVTATLTYAGAAPYEVEGLMQINVQIPAGVQPGGYVPVVLQVGSASTVSGAAWIAVSAN
jgi:uncharacterized protein (TIGR03437 family)